MTIPTNLNLYERINYVRNKIGYIQKDKTVSTGKSGSYKAVTHDQVTAMIRDHLVETGIICIPNFVSGSMTEPRGESNQWRYSAVYEFTFVNLNDPQDKFSFLIEAHAMDNADKAPGKALSYAKKYAMLKLFEIETGEDEESRYDEPQAINIDELVAIIKTSESLEELKTNYVHAIKTIKGNPAQTKILEKAKDEMKGKLNG